VSQDRHGGRGTGERAHRTLAAALLAVLATWGDADEPMRIVAGREGEDRGHAILQVSIPPSKARSAILKTRDGREIPAQIDHYGEHSRLLFVDPKLSGMQEYAVALSEAAPASSFRWEEGEGADDLLFDQAPILRYVRPKFDKSDVEGTKKPFHHVFDPNGGRAITKGPGGLYPHHRGIFLGYSKCRVGRRTFDTWHAAMGEHQAHQAVEAQWGGPIAGGHIVRIDWNGRDGAPFLRELRSVEAIRLGRDRIAIDFDAFLEALDEPVALGGDRQHAGVQFRAAQEVAENQKATRYLRPAAQASLDPAQEYNGPEMVGIGWDAIEYKLGDRRYTVAYFGAPYAPEGAGPREWSERLYGRFGEFIPFTVPAGQTVQLGCRIVVAAGPADGPPPLTREEIEALYEEYVDPAEARLASP
jgi:hypothetical protein